MTLTKITKKQQSTLTILYQFRFLNRIQIQKLLHHKYHKRIIDWLNDLTENEYIGKKYKMSPDRLLDQGTTYVRFFKGRTLPMIYVSLTPFGTNRCFPHPPISTKGIHIILVEGLNGIEYRLFNLWR